MLIEYLLDNLLQVHIGIAAVAVIVWLFRKVRFGIISVAADLLSLVSIPFTYEFYQYFNNQVPATSEGSRESAFFLLSFLTFGLVPIVSILGGWFFGRGIGRVIRVVYKKFF